MIVRLPPPTEKTKLLYTSAVFIPPILKLSGYIPKLVDANVAAPMAAKPTVAASIWASSHIDHDAKVGHIELVKHYGIVRCVYGCSPYSEMN